jgi:uncharacterized protein YbjQ (UPF0145 family)
MSNAIDIIFGLVLPALLIVLGLMVGRITEKRHFASLVRRERALAFMLVTDLRSFPGGAAPSHRPQLVVSEVILAADYFKSFIAKLKNLIGGELRSLETLVERARREALLRVMETAHQNGYDAVCNVRLETSNISSGEGNSKAQAVSIALIVSGTAYRRVTGAAHAQAVG